MVRTTDRPAAAPVDAVVGPRRLPGGWLGAALAGGLAVWIWIAASVADVSPTSALAPIVAGGAAYAAARLLGRWASLAVPLAVMAVGSALFILSPEGVLTSAPRA